MQLGERECEIKRLKTEENPIFESVMSDHKGRGVMNALSLTSIRVLAKQTGSKDKSRFYDSL